MEDVYPKGGVCNRCVIELVGELSTICEEGVRKHVGGSADQQNHELLGLACRH